MMARSSISTPSSTQLHPPPRGSSSVWPPARCVLQLRAQECGLTRAVGGRGRCRRGGGEQGQAVADHRRHPGRQAVLQRRGDRLCRFLVERGALIFLNDKDETIGTEAIYEKIVGGKYGCFWDAFQAYKHLKSLGYIVGRYGVPWTMKNSGTCDTTVPPSVVHTDQSFNRVDGTCSNITKLLKEMHIDEISPSFEVYLPNSKFKKSSPGAPSFLLCLLRNKPPSRIELEMVENNFGGIPLKYCHVDNGRVSFLSFDKVALPRLP
ncbi:uncharacterized protein LOC112888586 isoform X2 [Panicum hallii]|uniref:uncharacterized protein LOC112888586 isoform X2 n=1 Tax=Panicum hallii TaxID=206008 RepID=UPI000DF4D754|nr:uncharacterized protein LOC112888586 isoform X2 [Panicum hallii]XP_025810616.1 uncharacterized protein LOC112888586 isoform X2 [Panicum hallii]XP_025810617.1 uncharacterized protein LOC112888586 isoform X2 [Panicum hallii]XP_025810618.1 uncharacterized protein LOC112888586 isoform X2 [Panicum hallii]XP_025810619.1 uncharacterized protein LOC112888586 isoform X2 [Panicum hallii]XP_025810620.1 uncharacterized protein LOC112888586 isoform X2 [Panicum hallii]